MKPPSPPGAKKAPRHPPQPPGQWVPAAEMERIQDELREARETLDALRNGEVDAVVVTGSQGSQVYSLTGADQPYRVYVEQMQEGAVTVSSDGTILYCNQRFATMVGLPLERVISTSLTERISPESWETISRVFHGDATAIKHDDVLETEHGDRVAVGFAASPLFLESHTVICLVVTDLTFLKEQEALRLAKEVSDRANEAKDAFLAALSHELRTPLTPALMASADMETDESLPTEVRETAGLIRRCITMETRLIDDLLDITRIARGKLELKSDPVDLHLALRRALEVCQSDISAKMLKLELRLGAESCMALGDTVRIQQAFWNVIRNAVKFTPSSGLIVVRSTNTADGQIQFDVIDTGIGFDADASARLFTAFEQESASVTRRFGGLGLGLAISKSVVDAHGGTISGMSEGEGRGATFTLRFPLRSLESEPVRNNGAARDSSAGSTARHLRLLLVEDHTDTSRTMQALLRRMGHEVRPARSAKEALALATGHKFDLVISDLGLPDMNGLAMMRELRDGHGLSGIAVSGFGSDEDIAGSRAAGFIHHLTKPITFEKLAAMLNDIR
jgi:PAS domain S-box-containing protein